MPTRATTCARLESQSAERLAALRAAYFGPILGGRADDHALDSTGRCIPAGRGAFIVEVTELAMAPPYVFFWSEIGEDGAEEYVETQLSFEASWSARLSHVADDGRVVSLPERTMHADAMGRESADYVHTDSIRVVATFDFDGDGYEEAFVEHIRDINERRRALVGLVDGVLTELDATRTPHDVLIDVTGDGRPDIVTGAPFEHDVDCSGEGHDYVGLRRVRHSRPDGTFSDDDAEAIAATMEQCETVPELGSSTDDDAIAIWIGCARIRGVTTARILAALRQAFAEQYAEDETCFAGYAFDAMARTDPPFVIPRAR